MTAATKDAIGEKVAARKVAVLRVVGKSGAVEVFEPLSTNSAVSLTETNKAIALFESGDLTAARELFSSLNGDPLVQAYLKRIERELELRKSGQAWDSVWNLTEK